MAEQCPGCKNLISCTL